MFGLAGLAAASAGIAWFAVSHSSSPTVINTPRTPTPPASVAPSSPVVTSNTVDILTNYSGTELDTLNAVIAPFSSQHGITVNVESTRDLQTVLTTRIRGNNPPDITSLPTFATLQQFAGQNMLVPLDSFLDMNSIRNNYASTWIDLGSFNSKFYALPYKANSKAPSGITQSSSRPMAIPFLVPGMP